jgi:Phage integrase family
VISDWQAKLKTLFEKAKVPKGHAHRFQDTFATELLLVGVPLERVSILLGHSSIRITERHYRLGYAPDRSSLSATSVLIGRFLDLRARVHLRYTARASVRTDSIESRNFGGGRGIRTPGTVSRTAVFKMYGLKGFSVGSGA